MEGGSDNRICRLLSFICSLPPLGSIFSLAVSALALIDTLVSRLRCNHTTRSWTGRGGLSQYPVVKDADVKLSINLPCCWVSESAATMQDSPTRRRRKKKDDHQIKIKKQYDPRSGAQRSTHTHSTAPQCLHLAPNWLTSSLSNPCEIRKGPSARPVLVASSSCHSQASTYCTADPVFLMQHLSRRFLPWCSSSIIVSHLEVIRNEIFS